MPATLFVTGSPGTGTATIAAAAAIGLAARGEQTLLLSLGSAAALSATLGREVGAQPTAVLPQLEAMAPDPSADLAELWGRGWVQLPPSLARLAADELPLPPGAGALLALLRLAELRGRYQRIVVDAGSHDTLLLALGLPDAARWLLRLLLGLDRGPGQSRSSLAGAALPSGLMPASVVDGAQELRLRLERTRAELIAPEAAAACYVLRPDAAALAEARLAAPAIQLHGLAIASIAIGPLGPGGEIPEEAAAAWPTRPWVPFVQPGPSGIAGLAGLAPSVAACIPEVPPEPTIRERHAGHPALTIDLPGLPRGALGLTVSGDELVVRLGPYRRHILLPEDLRGTTGIRATREGDLLIIRRRV